MIPEFVNFMFVDFETTGVKTDSFSNGSLPIEIGCIFTDHNLVIKDTYERFIWWDDFDKINMWSENSDFYEAYKIHNIEFKTIKKYGVYPHKIAEELVAKIYDKDTFTIVSDNAYFETFFLHKIFNYSYLKFPFHYTSWDINLLLKVAGTNKIKNHKHRALDDAANMYHRTLRSLEKLNYFE